MSWGKKFLVVAVALAGGQFVATQFTARADDSIYNARQYTYAGFDSETSSLGTASNTISGVKAGTIVSTADGFGYGEDLGGSAVRYGTSQSFTPFGAGWVGGVSLAAGNVSGDANFEWVTGHGTGGSLVRTFAKNATGDATPLSSFQAYEDGFNGGVRVAVADVDGNGSNEIVVAPGPGRAPTVKVFAADGTLVNSADVYASTFTGGVFIAAANLDGDAATELVVGPGAGGGPHVRVFNGLTLEGAGFFAFDSNNTHGVRVGAGTLDGVPVIAATTRTATAGVVRVMRVNGEAASPVTEVPVSSGDLSIAIGANRLDLLEAAPRFAGLTGGGSTLSIHQRGVITLKGAGLPDTFEDIAIDDGEHPLVVYGVSPAGNNDLDVAYGIPTGTPTGPGVLDIKLTVRTPGGTATHVLTFPFTVNGPDPHAFVSTGVGHGGGPHVRTYSDEGVLAGGFMGGDPSRNSGVRVARSDLDNNGVDEFVLAYGPGQAANVRATNTGGGLLDEFPAYANFNGGVFVAAGDVDPAHEGGEIITGADAGGGPHVKIFSADGTEVGGFMAYEPGFTGGVRVAVADVDRDGFAEIVTAPGPGGGPHVRVFTEDGTEVGGFMAYEPGFTGGVFVAGADVDGDAFDEIVTGPGAGGGPHVRVFTETGQELAGFMAYAPTFTGGVTVARAGDDILGPNLIATGPGAGGGPHVRIFTAAGQAIDGFMAYDPKFTGGVFVAGGIA